MRKYFAHHLPLHKCFGIYPTRREQLNTANDWYLGTHPPKYTENGFGIWLIFQGNE